jgi:entericidin A
MKSINKILMLGLVVLAIGSLNGCGTVHGFGQDVSYVGHGISKAAN